jgi:hypothetical protein
MQLGGDLEEKAADTNHNLEIAVKRGQRHAWLFYLAFNGFGLCRAPEKSAVARVAVEEMESTGERRSGGRRSA